MRKRTGAPKQGKARRRTQDERSAETRQKLIEAAIAAISELGLGAATTTIIAERAGLTRGALQYHFDNRFVLLSAVIDRLSAVISSEMSLLAGTLPRQAHSLEHRLDEAIRAYWRIYTSNTFLAVLTIFLGVRSDPKHYLPLQRHMQAFYRLNDDLWLKLMLGSTLTTQELIVARRVLFGALRGLAIGRILGTQPDATRPEFDLIKRMFAAALTERAS
jgi:AcrR family transcriptional regulator